jgi:hypothetical protein
MSGLVRLLEEGIWILAADLRTNYSVNALHDTNIQSTYVGVSEMANMVGIQMIAAAWTESHIQLTNKVTLAGMTVSSSEG